MFLIVIQLRHYMLQLEQINMIDLVENHDSNIAISPIVIHGSAGENSKLAIIINNRSEEKNYKAKIYIYI